VYERMVNHPTSAYNVLGFVDTNSEIHSPIVRQRLLGSLEQLEPFLMRTVVDEVLIALPIKSHYAEIQRTIEECERAGVQSRYSPDVFPSRLARAHLESPDGQPAVAMKVVSDDYRLVAKRAIDIVVSTLGLVMLSPLLAGLAIAVKLSSPGPVLFGQERFGWRKRRFTMYKFRTMATDAETLQESLESRNEAAGPVFKIKDDPRVTPFGRFLRRSSLDELPQLWNVLRGEMSLVGPRPLPTRDVHRFTQAALMRRFSVLPGLTCLWQIGGRSEVSFDRWVELDLEYIDRWSLSLDFMILMLTVPAVLRARGAS
jgi:exopolysaccharide biosynthesis polyprenyl glycosylphosphotransferase